MICRSKILDYINREDIENIEELENNYKFMMEVIKLTRDKNMFNICSDEVKLNYEFIKFMVETFKKDVEFIDKIATEYIDTIGSEDVTSLELIFIMAGILKRNTETELALKYNFLKNAFITSEKIQTRIAILKEEDLFWKEEFGLGFIIMQYEYYHNSNVIMNEIALDLVEDIFYKETAIKLEKIIHNRFKTLEEFNKVGIRNFILNYVRLHDTNLADYLEVHTDLLKDMEKNIKVIVSRFDIYNENLEIRKNQIFYSESRKILYKYRESTPLIEYLIHIDKQHIKGLPILVPTIYDGLDPSSDYTTVNLNNITDYKIIKEIINLAKEVYLEKENQTDIKEIVINNKAKILDFKPNKKNNKRRIRKPNDKLERQSLI